MKGCTERKQRRGKPRTEREFTIFDALMNLERVFTGLRGGGFAAHGESFRRSERIRFCQPVIPRVCVESHIHLDGRKPPPHHPRRFTPAREEPARTTDKIIGNHPQNASI